MQPDGHAQAPCKIQAALRFSRVSSPRRRHDVLYETRQRTRMSMQQPPPPPPQKKTALIQQEKKPWGEQMHCTGQPCFITVGKGNMVRTHTHTRWRRWQSVPVVRISILHSEARRKNRPEDVAVVEEERKENEKKGTFPIMHIRNDYFNQATLKRDDRLFLSLNFSCGWCVQNKKINS